MTAQPSGSNIIDQPQPVGSEANWRDDVPARRVALCLSGGGYRARLFHPGALWRLNEVGYLPRIDRISSVSGGPITDAVLGVNWSRLAFNKFGVGGQFNTLLVDPIGGLSEKTIDILSVMYGSFSLGGIGNRVAAAYRKHLFHNKTPQDLPDDPRFVTNAMDVQSGASWRFMKPYMHMRDYRVGEIEHPTTQSAVAAAASSASPPFRSPVRLKLKKSDYTPRSGSDLQREPFTTGAILTDGGVCDNLALETAWKGYRTLLVGDAGGILNPRGNPQHERVRHLIRGLYIIGSQVRNPGKRQLLNAFKLRLRRDVSERLINRGYAVRDAARRKYVGASLTKSLGVPYPHVGVGQGH